MRWKWHDEKEAAMENNHRLKNNIIIAGVPRAGKSTISNLLSKQYGYQHISMDSIIAGFEKCFPETGVNTYQGLSSMETLHVISGKMAPFVRAMLRSGEYDEFEPRMYQIGPTVLRNRKESRIGISTLPKGLWVH